MTPTVVVAVDWSPVSKRAAELGAEIARAMKARIVLVHVRTESESDPTSAQELEAVVGSWASQVRNSGLTDVTTILLDGPPVDSLLNYVETHPTDLMVFGRRGHSLGARMLLGGITSSVLQHARCPVLVVP
ncbi:MAG: universal stress protein [Thermoplasmata archaeon]